MTHPKTLAVIRVFSSTDQKVLEKHAKIIEKLYGIPTRTYCIPNQLHARSAVSPYSAPEAALQPWRSRWAAVSGF